MTNVAVIYYSSTGNIHKMAEAAAAEAEKAGAEVRLRKVAELAPQSVVESNEAWAAHAAATADVPVATPDDLVWADVILLGTPTRFGLPSAQLKQFIDTTGGVWAQGKLTDKVVSSFTSSNNVHGGQESTLLALNNTFYHWGAIIVPPGFTDPVQFEKANGNPYGASSVTHNQPGNVHPDNLAAVAYQARRATGIATALKAGLSA